MIILRSSMYFAIAKISFETQDREQSVDPRGRRDLAALVEKIRAKFKVCVMACSNEEENGEASIAISSLAHSEEALNRQLNSLCSFCEDSGFGRISSEQTLLDHIDAIGENDSGDDEHADDDDDNDHGPDGSDQTN